MNVYVKELMECGLPFKKAIEVYMFFLREYEIDGLEAYIKIMKGHSYDVGTV